MNSNKNYKKHINKNYKKHTNKYKKKASPIIIGKIYADWCGHCISLKPIWNELKTKMQNANNNIVFTEIEEKQMKGGVENINNQYLKSSSQKLELQGGFPTLFKIHNKQLEYYNNKRDLPSLTNWITGIKGGNDNNNNDINNNTNENKDKTGLLDRAFFYFFGGRTNRKPIKKLRSKTKKIRSK